MRTSPSKTGYYVLEGLNSFATAYYFNYLLFLLRDVHGFSNLNNLTVAALHGLVYIPASLYGGRFGHRRGHFLSLRIGFGGLALAVALGWWLPAVWGQLLALGVWTIAICFTWPILEALVSEHEPPERLPNRVGLYNVVWAGTAAVGYSLGGWIFVRLGQGSLYWLPLLIHVVQFVATWPVEAQHRRWVASLPPLPAESRLFRSSGPRYFQRLAWMASPFNYMALNTVIALAPGIASRLGLGLAMAGAVFSVWFYVRALAFLKLWLWPGWHYRFGWFFGGFLLLLVSYVLIVLAGNVAVLIGAQVAFGWASALLYYSALYYSMDGSDAAGEQGGIHEALIGVGACGGPAVSAVAQLVTGNPAAPAWVVAGALTVALGMAWRIRRRAGKGF